MLAMLIPFLAMQVTAAGVMPGRSVAGTLTLVLCTPNGPLEMQVDTGGNSGKAPTQKAACPWALLHAPAVLPHAMPAIAAPVIVTAGRFVSVQCLNVTLLRRKGPPARAPPLAA
jgi:hypothetical protein